MRLLTIPRKATGGLHERGALRQSLNKCLETDLTVVGKQHAFTELALTLVGRASDDRINDYKCLHVYLDGSCQDVEGEAKSGWGFVVIAENHSQKFAYVGYMGGPTAISNVVNYIGADYHTSSLAEDTALVWTNPLGR